MSQHQLFLPFLPASALSPNSPVSLLLPFFHSRDHSPAQVSNLVWPILMPFETSPSLGHGLASPFHHHCPQDLQASQGIWNEASTLTHTPVLFVMGPTRWYRQTQPLPKRFRHSVLRMLRSPLEVRASMFWGLRACSSFSFCLSISCSPSKTPL